MNRMEWASHLILKGAILSFGKQLKSRLKPKEERCARYIKKDLDVHDSVVKVKLKTIKRRLDRGNSMF